MRKPAEIRDASIARFVLLAGGKFDKGQEENDDCLDETVTLEKVEEEVIDQWHYVQSLRYKIGMMEHNLAFLVEFYETNKTEEERGEVNEDEDEHTKVDS